MWKVSVHQFSAERHIPPQWLRRYAAFPTWQDHAHPLIRYYTAHLASKLCVVSSTWPWHLYLASNNNNNNNALQMLYSNSRARNTFSICGQCLCGTRLRPQISRTDRTPRSPSCCTLNVFVSTDHYRNLNSNLNFIRSFTHGLQDRRLDRQTALHNGPLQTGTLKGGG